MQAVAESSYLLLGAPFLQRVWKTRGQRKQQQQQQQEQKQQRRRRIRCQSGQDWNPDPQVDTRIHWSSPDEGWVGGAYEDPSSSQPSSSSVLEILTSFAAPLDSHYDFLGVRADVDSEEIKAAYRKLSKLYHPDSTSLPQEDAAQNFLRLQKAYDVLSSVEERRIYDWGLAQDLSRKEGGGFVWPYEVEQTLKGPDFQTKFVGEPKSNGIYIDFTGQMLAGLFFDAFALLISIVIIVYVAFFKH